MGRRWAMAVAAMTRGMGMILGMNVAVRMSHLEDVRNREDG